MPSGAGPDISRCEVVVATRALPILPGVLSGVGSPVQFILAPWRGSCYSWLQNIRLKSDGREYLEVEATWGCNSPSHLVTS